MLQPRHTQYILTADLQSGKTQYGSMQRQADNLRILKHICTKAVELNAGVLFAGDFFDEPSLFAERFHEALDIARETAAKGIYIGEIDGNHDGSKRSWFDFPESPIHCLHDQRLVLNGCQFHSLNFLPRKELLATLADIFQKNRPDVIMGHQMFGELAPMKGLGQFAIEDLKQLGLADLTFFLGDLHTSCDFTDQDTRIEIAYPGSPNITASNEGAHKSYRQGDWEDTRSYAILWTPTPGWPQKWERIPLPTRPWIKARISTYEPDWEQKLEATLTEIQAAQTQDPEGRKPIVNVTLITPNQHQLAGTRWEEFTRKAHEGALTFQPEVRETQKAEVIESQITEERFDEASAAPKLERGDADSVVLNLLADKVSSLPDGDIILELATAALHPDKNHIKNTVAAKLDETLPPSLPAIQTVTVIPAIPSALPLQTALF